METKEDLYDVVIVGGGAAGLSAALVLSRARRRVLVVDAGEPRNGPAAHMHGYLSRDGMAPADLAAEGRDEVTRYGGEIVFDAVTDGRATGEGRFALELASGHRVATRRVIVATGLRDELPDVPGLRERWARDVLHCPYCHGWEVRDRRLAVLGDGSTASVGYAQLVRQWADDVVLFVPPASLADESRDELVARAIGVVESPVTRLVIEGDELLGVETADGRVVARDAVFVPPRFVPNDLLLEQLGCERGDGGWIATAAAGATSVPGVRVAGNVANPRAQVITAAGEGSAAAIATNAELVEADVADAVRRFERGLAV